jgi:cytoskeletal protein CcmA (bactofilin family)
MSLNELILDKPKPWLNIRVNSIKLDQGIVVPDNPIFDNVTVQNDLQVDGNTNIDGNLTVNGDTTLQDTNISGDLQVSGDTDVQDLIVNGTLNVTNFNPTGNVTIPGNLTVNGIDTQVQDLTVNGVLIVPNFSPSGNLSVPGNFTVAGFTNMTIVTTSGAVQINDTLDVTDVATLDSLRVNSVSRLLRRDVVPGQILFTINANACLASNVYIDFIFVLEEYSTGGFVKKLIIKNTVPSLLLGNGVTLSILVSEPITVPNAIPASSVIVPLLVTTNGNLQFGKATLQASTGRIQITSNAALGGFNSLVPGAPIGPEGIFTFNYY